MRDEELAGDPNSSFFIKRSVIKQSVERGRLLEGVTVADIEQLGAAPVAEGAVLLQFGRL